MAGMRPQPPKNLLNINTYRADAALGVAALRMPVALTELAVPQVQPPPGTGVTRLTILPGGGGEGRLKKKKSCFLVSSRE